MLLACAFSYMMRPDMIDIGKIEKITIRGSFGARELADEDVEKFVVFFNQAEYKGAGAGEGAEPEIQAIVVFNDGSTLIVNSFNGKNRDFEVFRRDSQGEQKEWYYLKSEDLKFFLFGNA
jgi:hypothetical protein